MCVKEEAINFSEDGKAGYGYILVCRPVMNKNPYPSKPCIDDIIIGGGKYPLLYGSKSIGNAEIHGIGEGLRHATDVIALYPDMFNHNFAFYDSTYAGSVMSGSVACGSNNERVKHL